MEAPGRLHFRKSLDAVNRALEVIVNEAREGKLRPQQANACINGLNSVAAKSSLRSEREGRVDRPNETIRPGRSLPQMSLLQQISRMSICSPRISIRRPPESGELREIQQVTMVAVVGDDDLRVTSLFTA
jgi:hypothetical protein